ncbi:MAG: protein phosphatase 2C domain-containing protein [Myxococcota bacterium]
MTHELLRPDTPEEASAPDGARAEERSESEGSPSGDDEEGEHVGRRARGSGSGSRKKRRRKKSSSSTAKAAVVAEPTDAGRASAATDGAENAALAGARDDLEPSSEAREKSDAEDEEAGVDAAETEAKGDPGEGDGEGGDAEVKGDASAEDDASDRASDSGDNSDEGLSSPPPPPSSSPEAEGGDDPSEESGPPIIDVVLFGQTDVGQVREHNEDNLLIADLSAKSRFEETEQTEMRVGEGGLLLAVCDGMGGAAAGEVASQLAADIVYHQMAASAGHCRRDQLALDLVRALEVAGARILDESNSNRARRGMGTTATVAALVDDHLLLGQVGDSRAYILRRGRLVQVTRDQSLVNQLIEAGQLTEEEAENFEHSNIILQALGTAETVQVDLTFVELRAGDSLMMCSDGLSGMIRDGEIRDTMSVLESPAEMARVLIEEANEAGGHDNITVIVARFDGEGLSPPTDEEVETLRYAKYALPQSAGYRSLDSTDGYDDTPQIEIHGEFEVDPHTNWDDILEASTGREQAGDVPNMVVVIAIAVFVFAVYYFVAR